MIKSGITAPQPANMSAIAAVMDEMALQMDNSAGALRTSPLSTSGGDAFAKTISGIEARASQIRDISREFRESGDMASFEMACNIAGCHPDPAQLQAFQASFH